MKRGKSKKIMLTSSKMGRIGSRKELSVAELKERARVALCYYEDNYGVLTDVNAIP